MKELDINKLVDIFNEKYPMKITSENTFRKSAKYITISVEAFEKVIAEYVEYLKITNEVCMNPANFIYTHSFEKNYKALLNDYLATKQSEVARSFQTERERLCNHFETALKPRFACNYKGYSEYIDEVRHLFNFTPCFEKDKITGELKVSEERCNVVHPYPLFRKDIFLMWSKEKQLAELKKIEWNKLTFAEQIAFIQKKQANNDTRDAIDVYYESVKGAKTGGVNEKL